ncbi:MAG: hypothetical protein JNK81_13755 [Anaerolineales bacterium]|nr:hypothetical protein [Anaerolineales bacterium]
MNETFVNMKTKLRSYYVFSLYGAMRGLQGSFVGSVIFAVFWILGPLLVLGFSDEMTQYIFSPTIVVIVPGLIFVGLIGSIVPGVIGGILLSVLLHNNLLQDINYKVIVLKGSSIGVLVGFLMWWVLWTFDPLNPPISIDRSLFVYYSITGILSTASGAVWAAMKLVKDSNYVLKDN